MASKLEREHEQDEQKARASSRRASLKHPWALSIPYLCLLLFLLFSSFCSNAKARESGHPPPGWGSVDCLLSGSVHWTPLDWELPKRALATLASYLASLFIVVFSVFFLVKEHDMFVVHEEWWRILEAVFGCTAAPGLPLRFQQVLNHAEPLKLTCLSPELSL